MSLPFGITLMLYSAHFEDGQPLAYSVRYLRAAPEGTRLADVMLVPPLATVRQGRAITSGRPSAQLPRPATIVSLQQVNLILLEERELVDAWCITLSDARAVHLMTVLRVTPGQEVRVGLLDGPLGIGKVEAVNNGRVALRCAFESSTPPRPRVDVLLALPRPKVMRRLWAQLAALGVGQIILTNAERVERHFFDTHIITEASYRPLLIEGLQQAHDTRLPAVSIHRQFRILVEDHLDRVFGEGLRLVADPSGTSSIGSVFADHRDERVLLAIGPEGGWNHFELSLLAAHGFTLVGLGPRTLRVDTACIALLSIAHAALRPGDSRPAQ